MASTVPCEESDGAHTLGDVGNALFVASTRYSASLPSAFRRKADGRLAGFSAKCITMQRCMDPMASFFIGSCRSVTAQIYRTGRCLYQSVDLKMVDELNRRTWAHTHQEVVSKTGIVKDIWSQPGEPPKDAWNPESDPILSKQPRFAESIPAAEKLRQSTLSHEYWRSRTWLPPELLPKRR